MPTEGRVQVWVTRWALRPGGAGVFRVTGYRDRNYVYSDRHSFRIGTDAHLTREAAVADAEQRRQRKIASLKRQIAKLEAMSFAEVENGE